MVNLLDLVRRQEVPGPWKEGENIPWNRPDFSERMLAEHLSQAHDLASRRSATIEKHVAWIHEELLAAHPTRILDLACGPGLYSSRLARLGHECLGIDFGPASIAHATDCARKEDLNCRYLCEDIRKADYGCDFGLAMLIFGEFNIFSPAEAEAILRKAHGALAEDGLLLLEPSTADAHRKEGRTWYSAKSGLFSDRPHLCLEETHSDAASRTVTTRFYIVDASSGNVTRHALTNQIYTDREYEGLLVRCGFADIRFFPSLAGADAEATGDFIAIVARKPA